MPTAWAHRPARLRRGGGRWHRGCDTRNGRRDTAAARGVSRTAPSYVSLSKPYAARPGTGGRTSGLPRALTHQRRSLTQLVRCRDGKRMVPLLHWARTCVERKRPDTVGELQSMVFQ